MPDDIQPVADPTNLSDDEFNSRYSHTSGEFDGTMLADGDPAQFSARYNPGVAKEAQLEPDGPTALHGIVAKWSAMVKPEADAWKAGQADVDSGVYGAAAMAGILPYEKAQKLSNPDNIKQIEKDLDTKASQVPFYYPHQILGDIIRAVPFLGASTAGGLVGAAGAAGAGAIAGGTVAGAAGIETGPGEAAVIPAGAATGAAWSAATGFAYGSATVGATVMGGQTYMQLRQAGISDTTARVGGVTAGAAMGALQLLQLGSLTGIGRQAAITQLKTVAGQATVKGFILNYAKHAGIQMTELEAQAAIPLLTQYISSVAENNPGAMPTKEQVRDTFVNTFKHNIGLVAISPGAAMVAGKVVKAVKGSAPEAESLSDVIGKVKQQEQDNNEVLQTAGAKTVKTLGEKIIDGKMTVVDAFKLIAESAKKEQPHTQADIDAIKKSNDSDILDGLKRPTLDESNGEPPVETAKNVTSGEVVDDKGNVIGLKAEAEKEAPTVETPKPSKADSVDTNLKDPTLKARHAEITDSIKAIDAEIEKHEDIVQDSDERSQKLKDDQETLNFHDVHIEQMEEKLQNRTEEGRDTTELKAKIKRINKERSDLAKSIEKQKVKLDNAPKPAKSITALDKLYDQRDTLDTERQAIEQGLVTADEIGKGKVKLTVNQVTSLRAQGIGKILKAYAKGVRDGTVDTKTAVRDVQTQVTQLIRKSGLDSADQGKLIGRIKMIQTPEQFTKAVPALQARIQELAEAADKRQAIADLGKTLNKTKLKAGGKTPKGKFTADIQQVMDMYRNGFKDKDNLSKVSEKLQGKVLKGQTLTPDDLQEEAIARTMHEIKKRPSADINAIHEIIKAHIEEGRSEAIEKQVARQEELQKVAVEGFESIQGNDPHATQGDFDPNKKMTITKKTKQWLKRLGNPVMGWDSLMRLLSQDDTNIASGKRTGLETALDYGQTDRNYRSTRDEYLTKAREALAAHVSKKRNSFLRWLNGDDLNTKIVNDRKVDNLGPVILSDGSVKELTLSRSEAIKRYMESKDPTLRAGLEEGNKYTFEDGEYESEDGSPFNPEGHLTVEAAINKYLTPEDKAIGDATMKVYQDFYNEVVNPWWRERFNADLPFNEFYSPTQRIKAGSLADDVTGFHNRQGSMTPSSAITRVANALALKPQDNISVLYHHIDGWSHFISHEPWDAKVKAVINQPETKYIIESKFGKEVLSTLQYQHEKLTRQNAADPGKSVFKWLDATRGKMVTGVIGLRPVSVVLHSLGLVNYLDAVNPAELAAAAVHAVTKPKDTLNTLGQHPYFKENSGYEKEFEEAARSNSATEFGKTKRLAQISMVGLEAPTAMVKYIGGWAVYSKVLREGGTMDEALNAAVKANKKYGFDSSPDTRSIFQDRFPTLTAFGTMPYKGIQLEMEALRDYVNHPSGVTLGTLTKRLAIFHIGLPMAVEAARTRIPYISGRKDTPDNLTDIAWAGLFGQFGEAPFFGDIMKFLGMEVSNKVTGEHNKVYEPSTPFTTAGSDVNKTGHDIVNAAADPSLENWTRAVDTASKLSFLLPKEVGGGLPIHAGVQAFEHLFGIDISKKSTNQHKGGLSDLVPSEASPTVTGSGHKGDLKDLVP